MTNQSQFPADPALQALAALVARVDAGQPIDLSDARQLLADAARRENGRGMSDVTAALITELLQRDTVGIRKYGTSLDHQDLTLEQWLQHLKEELMDGAGYIQSALNMLEKTKKILSELDEHGPRLSFSPPTDAAASA